jgi:hypothetical protein
VKTVAESPSLFDQLEPEPYVPSGSLYLVESYLTQVRRGRLDAEAALALSRAEDELKQYRAHLQRRDAEVTATGEGKLRADASVTSMKAARSITLKVGTQRARVLADIASHDGATDHEVARRLSMLDSSVRPRRGELVGHGYVVDSGRTREHQGSQWSVWVATPAGLDWHKRQIGHAA